MDTTKVIKYHFCMFKFFGILRPENATCLHTLWGLFVFTIVGIGLLVSQAMSLFFVKSLNESVEHLLLFCTTSTTTLKVLCIYRNQKNLTTIMHTLQQMELRITDVSGRRIMNTVFRISHRVNTFYLCIYAGTIFFMVMQTIFLEKNELAWKSTVLLPYDFAQKPSTYYGVLVFQAITNTANCAIALAADTYGMGLNNILGGHIEVLGSYLEQLGTTNSERINPRAIKPHLIDCLQYYRQFLTCTKSLNKIMSTHLLVQFGISAPVICTCAYQLSQAQRLTTLELVFLCSYTCGIVMQVFVPSYIGTIVMVKSYLLTDNIYASNWINFDKMDKISMRIFMRRALKPFVLYAGRLFPLNLDTFIKILKTAYSMLAVLQSTQP